jgi:hypothetical protein
MRFGEHVYRTSNRARQTKLLWCVLIPAFFAAWALHYYWESRRFDWLFVLLALQAIVSAIALPRFFDRTSLKTVYRRYIIRPNADDSGSLQLLVSEDAVTEIAPARQTTLAWTQVHKVDAFDDRIYVYADPRSAIIIPRHTFEGDRSYEDLRTEILRRAQQTGVRA